MCAALWWSSSWIKVIEIDAGENDKQFLSFIGKKEKGVATYYYGH